MLNDILTIKQRNEIIGALFCFEFIEVSNSDENPHYVLFNDEGNEFYGNKESEQFKFDTLSGIFKYLHHTSKQQGIHEAKAEIRKALDL